MSHAHASKLVQNPAADDDVPLPIIDFSISMSSIDQQLAEALRSKGCKPQEPAQEERNEPLPVYTDHPAATHAHAAVSPSHSEDDAGESGLLAELAREAEEKLGSRQTTEQDIQAKAQRLHQSLGRIVKFLNPFVKHVNNVGPEIPRSYRLDARTVYTNLKWQEAAIDYRNQDLSSTALLGHITLSINLCAPEPVVVTRPWPQLEALKKELHNLRLRALDEQELDSKKAKQEWLQVRLASDFPVQIRFQGNYAENRIDVLSRNIESFGVVAFRLEPEAVTPGMLDDFGRFLIGRADRLPTALQRV